MIAECEVCGGVEHLRTVPTKGTGIVSAVEYKIVCGPCIHAWEQAGQTVVDILRFRLKRALAQLKVHGNYDPI